MAKSRSGTGLEDDISIHIFTVSAGMVGVCLTVISLLRVIITLRKADMFANNLLAIGACLFFISCLSSYWALRTRAGNECIGGTFRRYGFPPGAASDGGRLRLRHLRHRRESLSRTAPGSAVSR